MTAFLPSASGGSVRSTHCNAVKVSAWKTLARLPRWNYSSPLGSGVNTTAPVPSRVFDPSVKHTSYSFAGRRDARCFNSTTVSTLESWNSAIVWTLRVFELYKSCDSTRFCVRLSTFSFVTILRTRKLQNSSSYFIVPIVKRKINWNKMLLSMTPIIVGWCTVVRTTMCSVCIHKT